MNKVFLIGRLTKDPQVRRNGDSVVANFTLAVDRTYKNAKGEKETDFIPVVAWRKTAEVIEKYAPKGTQIAISGRLQVRYWETQDGQNRSQTEVLAEEVQLLGNKQKVSQNPSEGVSEDIMSGFEEVELEIPF